MINDIKFLFDLPCRTSPWPCSRGSAGGCSRISSILNLYQRKFKWKNYDNWFINGGDIKPFNLLKKDIKMSYRRLSYKQFHLREDSRKGRYTPAHCWGCCKVWKWPIWKLVVLWSSLLANGVSGQCRINIIKFLIFQKKSLFCSIYMNNKLINNIHKNHSFRYYIFDRKSEENM